VTATDVSVAYGRFTVLENVDLAVTGGEIVALVGDNGAGKSALLSCLAGLHRPSAGTLNVLGGPPRDNAKFWRAVAVVAGSPTWYPGLTVREHLELVRRTHEPVRGWWPPARQLIAAFGLTDRADAVPLDLSAGNRRRLSLAAALARPSRLLLIDEPEQSLEPRFRQHLAAGLLREYAAQGGTVIMATHDLELAATAGARFVRLAGGRVASPEPVWLPGQRVASPEPVSPAARPEPARPGPAHHGPVRAPGRLVASPEPAWATR
jgi:ABC-type multidrug transport system ATPase subunit